jgi:hypothetical protein
MIISYVSRDALNLLKIKQFLRLVKKSIVPMDPSNYIIIMGMNLIMKRIQLQTEIDFRPVFKI